MTYIRKTQEGVLNPPTKKTSTQKWLEDWITFASADDQLKTKKWLESWIDSGPNKNSIKNS